MDLNTARCSSKKDSSIDINLEYVSIPKHINDLVKHTE